ncbi:MAG: hypothetical protein JNG89_05150 [Planctomycetaceae bacterium]|nr:hypothetical protein [Planctomycetaceae bacterium]
MAHAYTPGLQVTARTRYRAHRQLPIDGEVLVRVGDRVQAQDIVARTELPGNVYPLNLANQLALSPADVRSALLKREGESIAQGEVLARTKGIFGMFKSEYAARTDGRIESVSGVTGQVIIRGAPIPVEVRAYLTGDVVEVLPGSGCVIEADAVFVQGIFGIGGEAYGTIRIAANDPQQRVTPDLITADMQGQIVVGGARVTQEAVRQAISVGVAAIVTGGIDDHDLREILGYDLGVAITGSEQIGVTLVMTEGFGDIAMAARTHRLLREHAGQAAAANGATQIRAGVMRPEVVIPLAPTNGPTAAGAAGVFAAPLELGAPVRIIRDPWFGVLGKVTGLPPEPRVLASGSKARVLEVLSATGERLIVPRANVEIIGE